MFDPLNPDASIELQGVETALPTLPAADYLCQVKESVIGPNKRGDGYNWKITFGLASPAKALDGRDVKVDFPLHQTTALQPAPDSTDPDGFRRQLGQAIDGIFGSNKENRPAFNRTLANSAVGKMVMVTTKVGKNLQGDPQTEVSKVKPYVG
jgi:hypothetical protein